MAGTMSKFSVRYEPNRFGGRLCYFGRAATSDYWDELWKHHSSQLRYERYESGHLPRFLQRTFGRFVPPGSRVLEAGCGLGWFTVAARARGYRAAGVDYAPQVIAVLQRRFPDIPFFEGDVRDLPQVAANSYDAVYSPGVCEHFVEGPEAVLAEAHRILRPGGILVVSTPCFNNLRKGLARLGAYRGPLEGEFFQYAFSPEEMRAILGKLGFTILASEYHGTLLTLIGRVPGLRHLPATRWAIPLSVLLDTLPITRTWGYICVWVARKDTAAPPQATGNR